MNIHQLDGNMYNIVHGTNRYADFWLGMLGIPRELLGRFRDCYLQRGENGELEICVYTRNGGGNRADYETVTANLRAHPLYLRDYDDDYDVTYAAYIFRPPPGMLEDMQRIVDADPEVALPKSHRERSEAFLHKMQHEPQDPEVQRVQQALRPTLEKISGKL